MPHLIQIITMSALVPITFVTPFYSLFYCYRPYNPPYMRSLPIFLFISAITEIMYAISAAHDTIKVFYTIFELVYFSNFLCQVIMSRRVRKTIWTLVAPFTLVMLYAFYIQNHMYITFWSSIIECGLLVFPCLYYFAEVFIKRKTLDLTRDPSFWVVLGIVYYFLVLIPTWLFAAFYYLHSRIDILFNIWLTNSYSEIICFSLFIYAMQCSRPRSH